MLVAALLVATVACGDSGAKDDKGNSGSTTGDGAQSGAQGGTASVGATLTIAFNPMYSAYDDGAHRFKIPVKVTGATGKLTVTTSPTDFVDAEPSAAGVMLTTRMAGTATVTIKDAAGNTGTANLTVTKNDPHDVDIGRERYANGVDAFNVPDGGTGSQVPDGGIPNLARNDMGACTFCHIPDGQPLMGTQEIMRVDVEHTPQQTAGYSDQDLIMIFTEGAKPPGAPYRILNGDGALSDQVAARIYGTFHRWSVEPKTRVGIVAYLRSLTPKAQGFIDFGGLRGGLTAAAGTMGMGPKVDPDSSCPGVDAVGGQNLAGCCTQGKCGLDVSNFGMGCIELGLAATQATQMGFPIQVPEPRACAGM
jgi:hypothetical protein